MDKIKDRNSCKLIILFTLLMCVFSLSAAIQVHATENFKQTDKAELGIIKSTEESEPPTSTEFSITPKRININYSYFSFNGGYVDCQRQNDYEYASFLIEPATESIIKKVTTNNKKVVKLAVKKDGAYYSITPIGVGSATITCEDEYGNIDTCVINVTNNYIAGYINAHTSIKKIKSGCPIEGHTFSGATVSTVINKKKYSAKADGDGYFSVKVPVVKIGKKIKLTVKYHNGKKNYSKRVNKPKESASISTVYRTSKTVKVTARKIHKGDIVSIKIGKKIYNRKIKKNVSKTIYRQKIKRTKEGSKIRITIKNKYKQTIYKSSYKKVYYAADVKRGMTKRQCKLVPGWEHPEEKYVNGAFETWWYGDYESYLTFKNGRLYGWHD